MNKRFIISIDEEDGNFEITTPDGHMDYSILIETLDMIMGILLQEDTEDEMIIPVPTKILN